MNGDEIRGIKYGTGIFIKPRQYAIISVKQMYDQSLVKSNTKLSQRFLLLSIHFVSSELFNSEECLFKGFVFAMLYISCLLK